VPRYVLILWNRFRWAYCQLEALRHCLPASVPRTLEEIPETLDETYERVLREINKANREHARRLLQCLTVALRPLRVEELAEVLAIDYEIPSHGGIPELNPNWRWTDQHQAVLSTCSSLIAIVDDGDSQVVQFSHFSVKEFLTSDRLAHSSKDVSRYHILLESAHTILTQACLGVILRLDDQVDDDGVSDIPLVSYASQHLLDHAGFENVALYIRDSMEYFFDADKSHWTAWCRARSRVGPTVPIFPLYFAALGGFFDLAEHLIGKHPGHINARGEQWLTPLGAALDGRHFQVAELLYQHGADVDAGRSSYTPLYAACNNQDLDIAQWLLNHGANVNTQAEQLWAPLHDAVDDGLFHVCQMLIDHNADIDIRTNLGKSPLHLAASSWVKGDHHIDIMQLLLDHGANPNARDNDDSTPLHHSCWWETGGYNVVRNGTVEGTRLLLKHGAIIDAEDNEGRTPLQLALEHGRHDIAACLLEHGAAR
jgi:ankyrin repeat protein